MKAIWTVLKWSYKYLLTWVALLWFGIMVFGTLAEFEFAPVIRWLIFNSMLLGIWIVIAISELIDSYESRRFANCKRESMR